MNFAKFLRTPFLTEQHRWLILESVTEDNLNSYLIDGKTLMQRNFQGSVQQNTRYFDGKSICKLQYR